MGAPWRFLRSCIPLSLLSPEQESSSGAARQQGSLLPGEAPGPLAQVAEVVLRPWKATWADVMFSKFGPTFPGPDASQDDWENYFRVASLVPLIFLVVGVVLSCSTCFYPCWRGGRRSVPIAAVPLKGPIIWCGALVALLVFAGTFIYLQTGLAAESSAEANFQSFLRDMRHGDQYASELERLGALIKSLLEGLEQSCPFGAKETVKKAMDPIIKQAQSYTDQVAKYGAKGERLHQDAKRVADGGEKWVDAFLVAFIIPLALVLLCCLTATVATICTWTARVTKLLLRYLTPLVFGPSLLFVAVAISMEFGAGVVVSSFCLDTDNNTLAYCKQYCSEDSTDYAMVEYYVAGGEGDNPLLDEVAAANSSMEEIKTKLSTLLPYAELCPEWHDRKELEAAVDKAQTVLGSVTRLFAYEHVFPYYDKAVYESICTTLVTGVGTIAVFQIFAGLVGLPILLILVHKYMQEMAQYSAGRAEWPGFD